MFAVYEFFTRSVVHNVLFFAIVAMCGSLGAAIGILIKDAAEKRKRLANINFDVGYLTFCINRRLKNQAKIALTLIVSSLAGGVTTALLILVAHKEVNWLLIVVAGLFAGVAFTGSVINYKDCKNFIRQRRNFYGFN